VLLACQGQLRFAPSGHVIGIDMDAALNLAVARGCDRAALSELLPAAEAGVLEALWDTGVDLPQRRGSGAKETRIDGAIIEVALSSRGVISRR
jgi:hypothetical protein